jgi:uncharacterized damage-inducible protein DinB
LIWTPAIKPWLDLWDYLDGNFWSVWGWAAKNLSPAEAGWQPAGQVASIGWNLQHLAEMLDHYIAHVFELAPQIWPGSLITMRRDSQDDGRFRDLRKIAEYHRRVRPVYREFLASRTLAELDRPLEPAAPSSRNYAWAIGHIAEHESYHLGKVTLLRNLLAGRKEE